MTPLEAEFPQLAGINPGFPKLPGTTTNCVECVNAFMRRMAGQLDAVAVPSATKYPREAEVWGLGINIPLSLNNATTAIIAEGEGAFGAVEVIQTNNVNHVIGFINKGGVVHYIDTQSGNVVTLSTDVGIRISASVKYVRP